MIPSTPHDDTIACKKRGETILAIQLNKHQLLSANGSQNNTTQAARYYKKQLKNQLQEFGYLTARNHITKHGITPLNGVDIAYIIHYPRNNAADPDNLFPTIKPLIDGFTKAGLWQDDSSTYIRARTYYQSPASTKTAAQYLIEIHIQPITESGTY